MKPRKSRKKWIPGGVIRDIDSFYAQEIIFLNGKAYHWAWIHSQPSRLVMNTFKAGLYRYAVPIDLYERMTKGATQDGE